VVVVAVLGLVIAGRLLGRRGGKTTEIEPGSVAATAPATSASTPAYAPGTPGGLAPGATPGSHANGLKPPGPTVASNPVTPGSVPGTGAGTAEPTEPTADWSAKLDDILGSNDDESKKADLLLAMWKTLPEDGQVEIMQHISNLLPDEKFSALAQTFTNASTPEAVLDIIMTDTLNRPNGIKLPVLLDVARTPGHPKAEEARDILEVFVDADHGTDWAKWEKAVKDWLKENPDEPEGTN
jgi:hypothetical protein